MSHPSFTRNIILLIIILFGITGFSTEPATDLKKCSVIAYYPWNGGEINQYPVEKLTHIIFSFVHIKGNILVVDNASDSLSIRKMIALKKRNPALKVIL